MITENEYHAIQQEELQCKIEIQERALISYSKAIYENIGQILSLAKIKLYTIEPEKPNDTKLKVTASKNLIGKAIRDLRQITQQPGIREVTEKGVALAIEYELQRIQYLKSCKTEFILSGSVFRIDKKRELILFSIVQEIIQDVLLLHANKLIIKMHCSAQEIEISMISENKVAGVLALDSVTANKKLNNRIHLIGASLMAEKAQIAKEVICIRVKV